MKYLLILLLFTSCATINSNRSPVVHKLPIKPKVVKPYIVKKINNGEIQIFKPIIIKPTIIKPNIQK
jgi:hypothetical protein